MIKVNQDTCIGCGMCEATCSCIFEIKDGKSVVISQDPSECGCDIDKAISDCPVDAISND
jgi:ferredoxin